MAISSKTAAALMAIFVALLAGAGIILAGAILPGFQRLETENHAADRARVEANLLALGAELSARVTDYARWDETYDYFAGRRPEFPSENFYSRWFQDYGVDVVALIDDRGRLLWAGTRASDGAIVTPNRDLTRALVHQARRSLPEESGHGIAWSGPAPIVVAAARSTGDDGARRPHGQIIFGKWLSSATLRQQTQLEIALIDTHAPSPALAAHLPDLDASETTSWTTQTELFSLIALREADGDLSGAVLTQRSRELTALGGNSVFTAMLLFAIVSAVAVVAIWALLRLTVIDRLVRMQRHLDAQGDDVAPLPLAHIKGGDEIAHLAAAYNNLVQRVFEASRRERLAQDAREAAAAANKMKSDFLANISHRLRAPLDSVIGYAELIDEELADANMDSSRADLGRVTASARQLLTLINEILDLSKIEAGRMEINPESFRVEEMLQEAIQASPLPDSVDATVDLHIGLAYSDQKRLRQCIVNVLSHACRFAPDGRASLRARRVKGANGRDMLRFEVRHRGASITPEDLERAFEPFAGGASMMGGAGLGLAITRKLAALLGGDIQATTQFAGGAAFVISIPALLDEASERHPASSELTAA